LVAAGQTTKGDGLSHLVVDGGKLTAVRPGQTLGK
jgi:hypothetical protein